MGGSGRAKGLSAGLLVEFAELPAAGEFFAIVATRGVPEADSTFRATRGDFGRSLDCLFFFVLGYFFRHVLLTQNFLVGNVFSAFCGFFAASLQWSRRERNFFNLLDLVCDEDGRRRKAISTFSRERRKIFRRHAGSSERGKIGKSY